MKTITNYKLRHFLKQSPDIINKYVVVLRYLKPIDTKKQIVNMTFKEVEELRGMTSLNDDRELIKMVEMVQGIKPKKIFKRFLFFSKVSTTSITSVSG